MLDPAFASQIPAFRIRKIAQINAALNVPGVQASVSDHGTTFILRYSVDGFEDHVIIGRPPIFQLVTAVKRDENGKRVRVVEGAKDVDRAHAKRKIDLSTSDIQAIVKGWRDKRRAEHTLAELGGRRGRFEVAQ